MKVEQTKREGFWIQDPESRIQNINNTGYWILDPEYLHNKTSSQRGLL